jgi:aspartate/methionine/tyrosine aminotransferase
MVAPGDLFGPTGTGHVRVSFAVEDGRLREGLRRLTDLVKELETRGKPDKQRTRAA